MFVVKQVSVRNFILLIFARVVLRKVHMHSLFTLETVGFPECLLFLDSDKQLNQKCIFFLFIYTVFNERGTISYK